MKKGKSTNRVTVKGVSKGITFIDNMIDQPTAGGYVIDQADLVKIKSAIFSPGFDMNQAYTVTNSTRVRLPKK